MVRPSTETSPKKGTSTVRLPETRTGKECGLPGSYKSHTVISSKSSGLTKAGRGAGLIESMSNPGATSNGWLTQLVNHDRVIGCFEAGAAVSSIVQADNPPQANAANNPLIDQAASRWQ